MSKFQYEVIKTTTKKVGYKIFPSYKKIQEWTKDCYPSDIRITSTEVLLSSLIDHEVKTILNIKPEEEPDTLTFIGKQ